MKKETTFIPSMQRRYNKAQHVSYHQGLYDAVAQMAAEDLRAWRIEGLLPQWAESIGREVDGLGESREMMETRRLRELDRLRDRIITYLFALIRAERRSGLRRERIEAAQRLSLALRPYRGTQREGYLEQSAVVVGLLFDLRKEANWADVERLGLGEYVDELEAANEEFKLLHRSRSNQRAAQARPRAGEVRSVSDGLLRGVMARLKGAFYFAADKAELARLEGLVRLMNEISAEHRALYQQGVRPRKKKGD